jgi:hypothetical protein
MKVNELKMFEESKYSDIGMNELIVYTTFKLSKEKGTITREELVLGAFKLFPKKFSLKGHDNWPDSAVIDKRWLDCRHKEYLSGTNTEGLSILPKGIELVQLTEKKLKISSNQNKYRKDNRTRSGKISTIMQNSDGYKKFLKNNNIDEINEFDLREILHCTMDSTQEILSQSYIELSQHLKASNENEMLVFLENIKKKYISLFISNKNNQYTGGMLKKLNK